MRKDIKEAKNRLANLRKLAVKFPSSFKGMTLGQAINKMRKVREEMWEEKIAFRS